jgi:hypothetical protein
MEEQVINSNSDGSSGNVVEKKCFYKKSFGVIGYTLGIALGWTIEALFISGSMPISRSMPSSTPAYATAGNIDSLVLFGHFITLIVTIIFAVAGWKIGSHFCAKHQEDKTSFSLVRVILTIVSILSLFVAIPLTFMILLFLIFGPMH